MTPATEWCIELNGKIFPIIWHSSTHWYGCHNEPIVNSIWNALSFITLLSLLLWIPWLTSFECSLNSWNLVAIWTSEGVTFFEYFKVNIENQSNKIFWTVDSSVSVGVLIKHVNPCVSLAVVYTYYFQLMCLQLTLCNRLKKGFVLVLEESQYPMTCNKLQQRVDSY